MAKINLDDKKEVKEYKKLYYLKNKEKILLKQKLNNEKNKEKLLLYQKQYREKNKEKMIKFYGKIWSISESFILTIPKTVIEYSGFKKGDQLEVYIRKKEDALEQKETTKETTEKEED